MKKGICCAGNIIVDNTYPIDTWPKQGELTHITEGITMTTGGLACNTVIDLARLDPSLPLFVSGYAGHDAEGDFVLEELKKYPNIDLSMIKRSGRTSFTAVMSNNQTKERTFFTYAGSTASFGEDSIDFDALDVDIFHIGYIMLLPALDEPDGEYGTKMARLLHRVQQMGIKTSIDVVTEAGERFTRLAVPALKYADYCIINELEAQEITGVKLRGEGGTLIRESFPEALGRLKRMGVSRWAVIHCPEFGCGLDENNEYFEYESLRLPEGFIKGTVGAGDAFCAGVLYAAEADMDMPAALRLGTCTAASSLSCPGASSGIEEVKKVLKLEEKFR